MLFLDREYSAKPKKSILLILSHLQSADKASQIQIPTWHIVLLVYSIAIV